MIHVIQNDGKRSKEIS